MIPLATLYHVGQSLSISKCTAPDALDAETDASVETDVTKMILDIVAAF